MHDGRLAGGRGRRAGLVRWLAVSAAVHGAVVATILASTHSLARQRRPWVAPITIVSVQGPRGAAARERGAAPSGDRPGAARPPDASTPAAGHAGGTKPRATRTGAQPHQARPAAPAANDVVRTPPTTTAGDADARPPSWPAEAAPTASMHPLGGGETERGAPEASGGNDASPSGTEGAGGDRARLGSGGVSGGVPGGAGGAGEPARFAETMTPPRLVSGPPLAYTQQAIDHQVEGTMVVECVVQVDGAVRRCQVVKGLPFLDHAIVSALEQRRYRPATLDGSPLDVRYTFKVRLTLPR